MTKSGERAVFLKVVKEDGKEFILTITAMTLPTLMSSMNGVMMIGKIGNGIK